jgi:hypothetical protein
LYGLEKKEKVTPACLYYDRYKTHLGPQFQSNCKTLYSLLDAFTYDYGTSAHIISVLKRD